MRAGGGRQGVGRLAPAVLAVAKPAVAAIAVLVLVTTGGLAEGLPGVAAADGEPAADKTPAARQEDALGALRSPLVAWAQYATLRAGLRPGGGMARLLGSALEAGGWLWADARGPRPGSARSSGPGDGWVGPPDPVWQAISDTGSGPGLALGLAVVALLDPAAGPAAAAAATGAVAGATATVVAMKWVVGRARPEVGSGPFTYAGPAGPLREGYRWESMPSGHAAASRAAAAALARAYPALAPALYLWTALVSLSRVELQQHWPGDVGAGAAIGARWAEAVGRGW